MADILDLVDVQELRNEVQKKYRDVAEKPDATYHFHTGRQHAIRLGYDRAILDQLPEEACKAFAGMANPFHWETPAAGERVVDLGSGGGMDSFFAALCVGKEGRVVGVDMTSEMVERSRHLAKQLGFDNVEFRVGYVEKAPVDDGWADVVISNGVFNLCPDKIGVCREVARILRPGGRMMIADMCIEKPIPESALRDIDLWTGWIAGALPCAGWETVIRGAGMIDVELGPRIDSFAGASGEDKARQFGTYGYPIRARKPA